MRKVRTKKVSLNSFIETIKNQFEEDLLYNEVYSNSLEHTCSMTELSLAVIKNYRDKALRDCSYLEDICGQYCPEENEQWLKFTKEQKQEIVTKAYSEFLKELKECIFQDFRSAIANTITDDDIALELGMKLVGRYMGNSKKIVKTYILSKGSK